MSGPRQVRRIAHKATRLLSREGYGVRSQQRVERKDYGPVGGCPKIPHASEQEAQEHLHRLVERGDNTGTLNVYRCPVCSTFHVGHDTRRDKGS